MLHLSTLVVHVKYYILFFREANNYILTSFVRMLIIKDKVILGRVAKIPLWNFMRGSSFGMELSVPTEW